LVITSAPSGAAVQINGVFVGRTPYQKDIPGGYLHKQKPPWARASNIP